jgi:hypothetical protein
VSGTLKRIYVYNIEYFLCVLCASVVKKKGYNHKWHSLCPCGEPSASHYEQLQIRVKEADPAGIVAASR